MFDTVNSLAKKLTKKMDEAYTWGSQNGWPVMKDYPQYSEIQNIGKKLYSIGKENAMQKALEIASQTNTEYSGMLNYFFRGIGDWMS